MTEPGTGDPLALGQRIIGILESGQRTATYKLATLVALVDHCVENVPEDRDAPLAVPIDALAHRVLESYWRQTYPFEGQQLRQSTQPIAKILRVAEELRSEAGARNVPAAIEQVRERRPGAYASAIAQVGLTLVQQPLHRLQKVSGAEGSRCFLYDDSWMNDQVSRRTIQRRGGVIELYPRVAFGLARLSGLLKPTIEIFWVDDVRRMNRFLDAEVPDVAGHLFGRERLSLAPARDALNEAFGPYCFYCSTRLRSGNPVDHVLPWSRLGIDGLANLVSACQRCNGNKSHSLPAVQLVDRALSRDRATLEQIAATLSWPTQFDRVVAAARGLYLGEPVGSPTWSGVGRSVVLDLSFKPWWIEYGRPGHSR